MILDTITAATATSMLKMICRRARTGPPVEPSDERCHDDDKKKPEAIVVWADERRDPDERPCYEGHPLRRARSSCTPGHRREGFYLLRRMRLSSGHAAVHPRFGFLSPLMPQWETRKRRWKRKPYRARYAQAHRARRKALAPPSQPASTSAPGARADPAGTGMGLGHVDGDGLRYAGPEHRHSRDRPEGGNRATARHRKARECSSSRSGRGRASGELPTSRQFRGGSELRARVRVEILKRSCAVVAWDVALEGALGLVARGYQTARVVRWCGSISCCNEPGMLPAVTAY